MIIGGCKEEEEEVERRQTRRRKWGKGRRMRVGREGLK